MAMPAFSPKRIVIIEDSPELCESWQDLLSMDGHRVDCFLDGHAMLQRPETLQAADVVITDYYLPDMNGMELIQRIRAIRGDVPVLLLSGMRDSTVVQALRRLPRAVFVPKPAGIDELESALGKLLAS